MSDFAFLCPSEGLLGLVPYLAAPAHQSVSFQPTPLAFLPTWYPLDAFVAFTGLHHVRGVLY